jgi:hypothetical protein
MDSSKTVIDLIGSMNIHIRAQYSMVHSEIRALFNQLTMFETVIQSTREKDNDSFVSVRTDMCGYICSAFSTFIMFECDMKPLAHALRGRMIKFTQELELLESTQPVQNCLQLIHQANCLLNALFEPLESEYAYANIWHTFLHAQLYVPVSQLMINKVHNALVTLNSLVRMVANLPVKQMYDTVKNVREHIRDSSVQEQCDLFMEYIHEYYM